MPEIRFYSPLKNGYTWLSNFSPHSFMHAGRYWPTVEHLYQAMKFDDPEKQELIRLLDKPWQAKRTARTLTGIRSDWKEIRETVMRTALRAKFASNPGLVLLLKDTGTDLLIENSPTDFYWGCGKDNTGQNRLGVLLMELRDDPALGEFPPTLLLPTIVIEPVISGLFDL